jgi:hypothetical protein
MSPPGGTIALATAAAGGGVLIRTFREYGVGLRVESGGTLVVVSNGCARRSLVQAIEAHADALTRLIEARRNSDDA